MRESDDDRPSAEDVRLLLAALGAAARGDFGPGLALPRAPPLLAAFRRVAERCDAVLRAATGAAAAVGEGDLDRRLPLAGLKGDFLHAARALNDMMDRLAAVASAVAGVAREVRGDGRLGGRAAVADATGTWREVVDEVNGLCATLTDEVRGLARVTTAVARGELPEPIALDARGEVRDLNQTINAMLERLRELAAEVVRIGREVGGPETSTARPAAAGRLDGVAGIWKELTENMSAAEQRTLVARYRAELLASMSHELRTPLSSLLVLAKLLSDNREANLTATQVEYARTIYGSGGDLLALVNDILDLATVEAGRMRIQPTGVEVADVLDVVERTFRPVAAEKGLTFAVELAPGAPRAMETDPRRLHQILRNLLGNALKFTHEGGVTLRVAPTADGVAFAVIDTGIGIDRASQAVIFEPFRQADATTAHEYGGTGLGLSISRSMAELLGGTLEVASAPGRGSTFTLTLPLRHVAAATAHAPPAAPSPPPAPGTNLLQGRKVLVIDDDMRNVFRLAGALEHHGAEVLFAEHGAEGVVLLDRHPDVTAVLLASSPEEENIIRTIRGRPHLAALPIIAVPRPVEVPALVDLLMVATVGP